MILKPQDIAFIVVLVVLLFRKDARVFVATGIICLLLSIPLFAKYIFFTAERLTMYAFAFFLIAVVLNLVDFKHENRN